MKLLFGLLLAVFSIFALAQAAGVKPAACLQPHAFEDENPCRGLFFQYTYNAAKNECVRFKYGGCGGNDNNFDTKKECEDLCKK